MSASSTDAGPDASAATQAAPRPARYTAAARRAICNRLAEGESLRSICSDRTMPCWETVRRWLRQQPQFRADYAEAREHQADWLAAEALDAARRVLPATASSTRVLLSELHWQAARLRPRVYGERPQAPEDGAAEDEIAATLRAALARADAGEAGAGVPGEVSGTGDDGGCDGEAA